MPKKNNKKSANNKNNANKGANQRNGRNLDINKQEDPNQAGIELRNLDEAAIAKEDRNQRKEQVLDINKRDDSNQSAIELMDFNSEKETEPAKKEETPKKAEPKSATPKPKAPRIEKKLSKEIFSKAINDFNERHNTIVSEEKLAKSVSEAWELLISDDEAKQLSGQAMYKKIFSNMLQHVYQTVAENSYEKADLPPYSDLAKETNDLFRAAMLANTDIYTNSRRVTLYGRTSFGGMSAEEMADLSLTPKAWQGDQRSNKAWERQSMDAVNISIEWSKNEKPYDALMANLRMVGNREVPLSRKDIYDRLAAAELMLMSDESAMIPDPKDALKQIPDWNNRYWKALAQARENLGIPKYLSMRELIQSSYAAIQGVAINRDYATKENVEKLISKETGVLKEVDEIHSKKAEFAKKQEELVDKEPKVDLNANNEKLVDRSPMNIPECDDFFLLKDIPKSDPIEIQRVEDLQYDRYKGN